MRLTGLALGAEPENLVLSEPDRDILGRLAAAIAADLATGLCAALDREPPGPDEAVARDDPLEGDVGILISIADWRGRPLTRASIPLGALVPFVKAGVKAERNQRPLAPMTRAIERTSARIDVRLGETSLSLGELAGLAAGDVLILDRPIDDGAALLLDARPFARADLEPHDHATRLVLSHEPRDA
jgi:flagellar motor switch/type III secretory pathway protein FliN